MAIWIFFITFAAEIIVFCNENNKDSQRNQTVL